jgi:predicted O-methyltransferase YrrM
MDLTKSFDSLSETGKQTYLQIRSSISYEERRFFEGCVEIPGQMWSAERKLLYDLVKEHCPETVFEIGTWKGGGSTYFISQALFENKKGKLYTIESCSDFCEEAKRSYTQYLPQLLPYIEFIHGESYTVYPEILKNIGHVQMAFLDGGDEPQKALKEYEMFEPYFKRESVIAMHDWNSEKMSLFRPFLDKLVYWHKITELSLPQSQVGMAAFIHL